MVLPTGVLPEKNVLIRDGKIADIDLPETTREGILTIDAKGKLLSVPFGIQNPNGIQCISSLPVCQLNVGTDRNHGRITLDSGGKCILRTFLDSLIGSIHALLRADIVSVCQES